MTLPIVVIDGPEWLLFFVMENEESDLGWPEMDEALTEDGFVSITLISSKVYPSLTTELNTETLTSDSDRIYRQLGRSV
jgi:hypothetical protein